MPTTLPGGLWYPERDTILNAGAVGQVTVAAGDAVGAQFSFGGAVSVRGAGMGLRIDSTASDFTIALTALDGTVLRSTAWPGTRLQGASFQVFCALWDPYELLADTAYRLVCTATGAGTVTVGDAPFAETPLGTSIGISPERLGFKVRRVAGVWTESPDRRLNAALHIGGF